jgi:hypothetical protein
VIPLIGYGPDLSSVTPGVLTNCSALIPSLKGMEGAPSPQTQALPALAAACRGAAVCRKLDNTVRFFAGSATALYEGGVSSYSDVTRASGGAYALGSNDRWRLAQFGDTSLAAAKTDILQSSSSGAFANAAASAPKAAIVETANGFVFLFDVVDQATIFDGNERPHGWWAARSISTWTPSIANEAYTGTLTSSPGKIRAGKRFGDRIVAYKDRSMFLGTYVGQTGWDFTELPGEAGAVSQEVVVDVGTPENPKHVFMGFDNFYQFDGARAVPIGAPVRETVFTELNKNYSFACIALHDRVNSRVYFYYPVASAVTPDKCVVYNYRTGMWGRDDRTIEAAVEYVSSGLTYDALGTSYSTYADLPAQPYDFAFWSAGFPTPAIFNSSHVVQTLTGASSTSSMTTGDYGSDDIVSLFSRVQPQFLTKPTSATMTNYYKDSLGASLTTDTSVSMDSKGRFDVLRTANWHRALFEFNGDVEMPSMRMELQEEGFE